MKTARGRLGVVVALAAAEIAACAGGDAGGGIEGTGERPQTEPGNGISSIGEITGFGSIFVNGVEFSLVGTPIDIDGRPAAESDLRLGQVVTVRGTLDTGGATGKATAVSADIVVAGPVSAIDLARNRLTLIGQSVEVDAATRIVGQVEGQPLGGLEVGDDIEISGFANSAGVLSARSIEPRRPSTPLTITGRVADLDTAGRRLTINGQPVDSAGATLAGFGSNGLDGAPVQVSGTLIRSDGVLVASELAYRDPRVPGAAGDQAALRGWVTRYVSDTDFDVDGHPVTTTATTQMSGPWAGAPGVSVIRLDAFVEVTGKLRTDGVVEATHIEVANWIEFGVAIQEVTAERLNYWLIADVSSTSCDFDATVVSIDDIPASWTDLRPGDQATIYTHSPNGFGGPKTCRVVTAEHTLRGPVQALDEASGALVVMGQKVWLAPETLVLGATGADRGAVLAGLRPGDVVNVSGSLTSRGEIVAGAISEATASPGLRLTSLVQEVDTALKRLRVGSLVVDYSSASMVGFEAAPPAVDDRITLLATDPPVDGMLRADVLRHTGGPLRGELLNVVWLDGLVTRFDSVTDYAVEGRPTQPLPDAKPATVAPSIYNRFTCDRSKVHEDMRFGVLALGDWDGGAPRPIIDFNLGLGWCPVGRRLSFTFGGEEEPGVYVQPGFSNQPGPWPGQTILSGPVEAFDWSAGTMRVAGQQVSLNPATLFTEWSLEDPVPLTADQVGLGELVKLYAAAWSPGAYVTESVWTEFTGGDPLAAIEGELASASEPDFVIGVSRVHTTTQTELRLYHFDADWGVCGWETVDDPAEFWTAVADAGPGTYVVARGESDGGQFVATEVRFGGLCE